MRRRLSLARRMGAAVALCGLCSCATRGPGPDRVERERADRTANCGIEVNAVRLTAQEFMIDLRYRVIDPDRASRTVTRSADMFLIHEPTGKRLVIPTAPKIGRLRQAEREYEKGRVYFILFGNPGRFVRPGDHVALHIGNEKVGTYPVE